MTCIYPPPQHTHIQRKEKERDYLNTPALCYFRDILDVPIERILRLIQLYKKNKLNISCTIGFLTGMIGFNKLISFMNEQKKIFIALYLSLTECIDARVRLSLSLSLSVSLSLSFSISIFININIYIAI